MSGEHHGVDRLGRRYKIVDGRHVSAGGGESPRHESRHGMRSTIDQILKHWFYGARSGEAVQESIKQILTSKFGRFLNIPSRTAVGRYGRLYAAAQIFRELERNDPKFKAKHALKRATKQGALDTPAFHEVLRSAGVEVPAGLSEGEVHGANEDAEILKIVHAHNLSARELEAILSTHDIDVA